MSINGSTPATIIITDDHTVIRSTLRDWLCDEYPGLKVFEASSGENTLTLLASDAEPDLVLMDFHLPGKTGIETTRDINQEYPQLPVILLTIQEDQLYIERAIEAGAMGYVIKRKMYSDLLPAIKAVLDGRYFSSVS